MWVVGGWWWCLHLLHCGGVSTSSTARIISASSCSLSSSLIRNDRCPPVASPLVAYRRRWAPTTTAGQWCVPTRRPTPARRGCFVHVGGDRHEVHQVEACEVSEGAIAAALDKEANGGSQKLELERTALCAQWCRVCDHFERQQQILSDDPPEVV